MVCSRGASLTTHPTMTSKILVQYGSLRSNSVSHKLALEVQRFLTHFGVKAIVADPNLPLYDEGLRDDPKVQEYLGQVDWADGFVWISPELHGTISAVMKNQVDWMQLSVGAVRPTQGKTLAVMQVEGGSQSFNTVNLMRQMGRWMRMFTIPNQSSTPKAYQEFTEEGQLKDSPFRNRVIDVVEELAKFTEILEDKVDFLTDRYSERVESGEELADRMNLKEAV